MKTKNELIEEVLRLDGERTQGEWSSYIGDTQVGDSDGMGICSMWGWHPSQEESENAIAYANCQFIAHAPDMAIIIRDQQKQIELLVEALEYEESRDDYGISDKSADALAKIKSGEWLESTVQHNTKYEG